MSWFRWLCGLICRTETAKVLGLRVWILLGEWMLVSCVCYVGSGFCDQLITHLEEPYQVCVCWIMHDLETSTVRWYRPQLVHCSTHKKEVAWLFYVPWLFGQPSKDHVKIIYLLTAVWYPVCSLSFVSSIFQSCLFLFFMYFIKSHLIMKCIPYIVIVFISHSLFAIRHSDYSYSTTGLANFNPHDDRIICQGLACGPQLCITEVPKM